MATASDIIILAAGGTGGHIFPAEALASELRKRGWQPVLVTDRRFSGFKSAVKEADNGTLPVYTISTASLSGSLLKKLAGIKALMVGFQQSRKLLKKLQPAAVIGFGGYPSFPTLWVAAHRGIPTIIHEQNAVMGRANRVLARYVDRVALSFRETTGLSAAEQTKSVHTGNPVREAVRALRQVNYPLLQEHGMMHLLVLGGSLGATVFSKVVPQALASLPPAVKNRIRVDQQCRQADLEQTNAIYEEADIHADLAPFFHDVPARLASAHLVISRAGASTVAELMTAGRPAILVPYPHAMDDHQTTNGRALEEAGGGWVIPEPAFTPEVLRAKIEGFMNLPRTLHDAAVKAREAAQLDAAEHLADLVESLTGPKEQNGDHHLKTEKAA